MRIQSTLRPDIQISKIATPFKRDVEAIVENPAYLSAFPTGTGALLGVPTTGAMLFGIHATFDLSPALPSAMTPKSDDDADLTIAWEGFKLIVQDAIAPMIANIYPDAKPVVRGVQAIFATADFVSALTSGSRDLTGISIKGARVAQKGVELLNTLLQPSRLAGDLCNVSAIAVSTTSGLYALHQRIEKAKQG